MKNSELQRIIELWLEDPNNQEHIMHLEERIKDHPEALNSFRRLHKDFSELSGSNQIPDNPFFFSKLKFRMEQRRVEKSHVRRVRWAVYAATMSVSLVMGVVLGSQVGTPAGSQVENSEIVTSSEDIFAQEFLVADYSIDNALLVEIE